MQKIASLDASLLGRSDPRLFVREIEKRSSDLCKRMQVASAAAVAAARRGPAVTESENCCPGGGSRLASFFPLALWCLCPTVSLLTVPLLSLFVSLYSSTSILFSQVTGHRGRGETEEARWCLWMSGPATVHRPIDCRKWSTDSKASSSLRSLFPISSKIAFDWISQSRGIPWFVCFFWMKYPEPFNRRGNRWNVVFRSYTNSRCTILFLRRYS